MGQDALDAYAYTYDAVGNRTAMTDPDGTHNYSYDAIYQLSQATHPAPQLPNNPAESYIYDAVGNRTNSHRSAVSVYNNGNRLTQDAQYNYTYDANGNMTAKTDRSSSATTYYTYDAENRLTAISTPNI